MKKKKNSKNSMTSTKQEKEVTFSPTLKIREYPIIMGDNPAANGCPITLGWKVLAENNRNFELYEYARENLRVHGKKKLFMSIPRRSQLLLDAGYTQDQIVKRALEMAELQHLRQLSIQDGKGGGGVFAKQFLKGFNLMTLGVVGTATPPSGAAAPRRAAPPRKSLTARSA